MDQKRRKIQREVYVEPQNIDLLWRYVRILEQECGINTHLYGIGEVVKSHTYIGNTRTEYLGIISAHNEPGCYRILTTMVPPTEQLSWHDASEDFITLAELTGGDYQSPAGHYEEWRQRITVDQVEKLKAADAEFDLSDCRPDDLFEKDS